MANLTGGPHSTTPYAKRLKPEWWVYATPRTGSNKSVVGPFTSPLAAAIFVRNERPFEFWHKIAIHCKGVNANG